VMNYLLVMFTGCLATVGQRALGSSLVQCTYTVGESRKGEMRRSVA
jgi:hypothetical protein